jgi:protein-S-isoprenylcysteine O-methyltransferase Ste14
VALFGSITVDTQTLSSEPFDLRPHQGGCPLHAMFGSGKGNLPARMGVFAFGVIAYLMFFVTFLYAMGFTTRLLVPKDINTGAAGDVVMSMIINGAMLMLFVLQHTIMARPGFKRVWTTIVPTSMERSIFVVLASASLALTFWQWKPMPQAIWDLRAVPALNIGLTCVALFGYGVVLLSSFMVSHFDLFGLRQVWLKLQDREYQPVTFRLVGLYKLVRHPLMVGFLIAFWSTPFMTLGHLFFAIMTTVYIFFGTWIEERDLIAHFGDSYLKYRQSVRGFIPIPRGK